MVRFLPLDFGEHMGTLIDLIGHKFGLLTVIRRSHNTYDNKPSWLCKCACGNEHAVRSSSLRNGDCKSCGCLGKQNQRRFKLKRTTTHDCSKTKIYSIWRNMRQRCFNPKCTSYKYYGAKGINICPRWMKFENFLADMGHPPSKHHSIERINSSGNYEPTNCKWILLSKQGLNTRQNRRITFNGETRILIEWSFITGLHRRTISSRIDKMGWSVERALTERPYKKLNNTS